MTTHRTDRWLVLQPPAVAFLGNRQPATAPATAFRLPPTDHPPGAVAWIRYDDVITDHINHWGYPDHAPEQALPGTWCPVLTGAPYDQRPHAAAPHHSPSSLGPTFLVQIAQRAGGSQLRHVYSCARMRVAGLLFARVWSGPAESGEPVRETIRRAVADNGELLLRQSDETAQTINFNETTEVEAKFTLTADAGLWEVSRHFAEALMSGRLTGFIPDVGNEMQRWSYPQVTFGLRRDGRSAGYAAFIRRTDGGYIVKYKLFTEDTLCRSETFDFGVTIEQSGFEEYLRQRLPDLTLTRLPDLVRTRFDVNVISEATGHYFGIESDIVIAEGHRLRQLELEYHKSQATYQASSDTIESELFRLKDLVDQELRSAGFEANFGYYSKLSFLRDIPVPS
jgi:hypothetical protein